MLRAIIIAASIGAATYGLSRADSISGVVGNPAKWDGRHVKISGTISAVDERTAINGRTYVVFALCDGSCVRVFMDGRPDLTDGQALTVEGAFSAAKRIGEIQFQNDVQADSE
jgi:hypothetical protein